MKNFVNWLWANRESIPDNVFNYLLQAAEHSNPYFMANTLWTECPIAYAEKALETLFKYITDGTEIRD